MSEYRLRRNIPVCGGYRCDLPHSLAGFAHPPGFARPPFGCAGGGDTEADQQVDPGGRRVSPIAALRPA